MLRTFVLMCITLMLSNTFLFSQSQMWIISNQSINVYFINGVSSKEDIGGVECNALNPKNNSEYQKLKFTNYNDFNVSVLYKVEILEAGGRIAYKTGTIVLERGETKTMQLKFQTLGDIRLISRKIGSITGPIMNNSEELTIVSGYLICYPQSINIEGRANVSDFINKLNLKRVYNRTNWRLPSDVELNMLGKDNSDCKYYSTDNWNRYNVHPMVLIPVSDK